MPIYEVGEHDGQHFFSMGFVEGRAWRQGGRRPAAATRGGDPDDAGRRDDRSTRTSSGVIHRDLKPANILLDLQGNPQVTDFGLAKKLQADSGLTGTGQVMGTPSYMPPEQAGGRGEVGPAADVYALGAILYCLLTGRPPFQAATPMDTLIQVMGEDPVPPRAECSRGSRHGDDLPEVPGEGAGQAIRLGAALAEELRRYLVGEPIWRGRWVGRSGPGGGAVAGLSWPASVPPSRR